MSMSNRMHDRLCKLYRLVLAHMRNIEAAIALPSSPRKAAGASYLYAGHRLESLESRTLLSASIGGLEPDQDGQAPIVVDVTDSDLDPVGDNQDMGFNFGDVVAAGVIDFTLVSVNEGGTTASGYSGGPSTNANGSLIVFYSSASDLVADDTNDESDIFIYNRLTGAIERLSVDVNGMEVNGPSYDPIISSDGRYVSFTSEATNLVPGDTNGFGDIFVYDRQTQSLERVSLSDGGAQGDNHTGISTISDDGRYVSFTSLATNLVPGDTNGKMDILVYDRQTDLIERVSVADGDVQGNGDSDYATISANGRYVVFQSDASNLVAGDTNNATDVFVYDRQTSTIERVSVDSEGVQGNAESYLSDISSDGRYVTFMSSASNLVAGDTNNMEDIFVYDRQTGDIERVSVSSQGVEANGHSETPSISGDGRYVSFESGATNLVPGDTNGEWDVFVYDRQTQTIERVSLGVDLVQGNDYSGEAVISGDGRFVVFSSDASNLVLDDENDDQDVFVVELGADQDDEPEVTVSGNELDIDNDDTTPSIADGTDFGSVTQGENTVSHTFNVHNHGTATLFISDLTVPEGYIITEGLSESIEAGDNDFFTITLDTAVLGTKTGVITFTTNDTDEETVSFTITGTVNAPGEIELPNLTASIDDSSIVTSIVAGTAVRMKLPITVMNDSDVALTSNTRIDIQVYARPVGGGDDILLTTLTNQNVSNLKAGASKRFNASFTLPAEMDADDYVLVAVIDAQDVVEEADEDDNEAVGTTTISIAEAFVNLTATIDDSRVIPAIVAGTPAPIKLPITVSNQGNVALASNAKIAIQVFARPVGGGDDILLATLTDQNVSNIKSGASKRFTASFTLPAEIDSDDYVLVANVDAQDVVEESNEEDNEAEGTRTITIAEAFVNLTTTIDDSRVRTSIVSGTPTRMTLPVTVTNAGNIALSSDTRIAILVYARPVEGGDDILLATLSDQNVSNLKAGASKRFTASFTLPAEIDSDDYVLVANIDTQDAVEETDEDDNEAVGTTTVAIAEGNVNLTASLYDSNIPTAIVAGTPTRMTIQISVCNHGNIAVAANTRIDIQVFARPVEGGDDVLLTTLTNQNISGMAPDTGRCFTASFTLPAEIDSDDYVLVANIDSENAVAESNEADNEAEGNRLISIAQGYVNLTTTLDDSRLPEYIEVGSSSRLTLPITVTNGGNIALSSNIRIAIQIYARPVGGGADILLATLTDQNVSNLKAGASKRINASFTVSGEIDEDDYVLVVNVDSQNVLDESNEGDNLAVGTMPIYISSGDFGF